MPKISTSAGSSNKDSQKYTSIPKRIEGQKYASSNKNGCMDNEDLEKLTLDRQSPSTMPEQPLLGYHSTLVVFLVINVFLALLVFYFVLRPTKLPLASQLYDQVPTKDGKTFPAGFINWSQTLEPLPCGKSPTEAKLRGCHFDIISTAWLPPKCIDNELVAEFNAYADWQYYASPLLNETWSLVDMNTLGSLSETIWTTEKWHAAHCVFMWKKLNRAIVQGRSVDGEAIKQGHTDHCANTILDSIDTSGQGGVGTIEIIYPPC